MRILALLLFALVLTSPVLGDTSPSTPDLQLRASSKYDALCLVGVLTGDPFYVAYYPDDYRRYAALMTPQEKTAFANLKAIIKDQHNGLVGPQLTLWFSALDAETLRQMIAAVETPSAWKEALATRGLLPGRGLAADWTKDDWAEFDAVRPPLATALRFSSARTSKRHGGASGDRLSALGSTISSLNSAAQNFSTFRRSFWDSARLLDR